MKKGLISLGVVAVIIGIVWFAVFNKTSNEIGKVEKLEDLKNAKIGIVSGTTFDVFVQEKLPDAEIVYYNEHMDIVAALKAGQVDGSCCGFPVAFYSAKYNDDITYLEEPVSEEKAGIALRKEDTELLKQMDDFLTEAKNDGTLEEIERCWFDLESNEYNMPSIQEYKEGKPLIVGISANREPACFIDENGEYIGLDIEVAKRIGAYLKRPVEFVDLKFSAIIPALQSGKIDCIIATMCITEERKKSVNFTQEYVANPATMIIKK